MIFDRHTAYQVLTGRIGEHRIPVGPDGPTGGTPRQGRTMTIRTSTGVAGDVRILACARSRGGHRDTLTDEALEQLTPDGTLVAWVERWLVERDQQWLARRCPKDAAAHSTADEAAWGLAGLTDEQLLARFDAYWADRPVWCVRWEPVDDQPLFLAQTGGTDFQWSQALRRWLVDGRVPDGLPDAGGDTPRDRGYTRRFAQSLPGAGEVFDAARLDPAWRDRARARHASARGRVSELARSLRAA